MVCIGSIAELELLSGQKVADLHRETVDNITIPSKRPGNIKGPRINDIMDYFEPELNSGLNRMPFSVREYGSDFNLVFI